MTGTFNAHCRTACLFLLTVSLLLSVSACNDADREQTIVIRFPHVTAPATPKGQAAERFRQRVAEQFGDRVKVEVFPSGQLMNDDDSLDALAFGEIQMIAVSLSKFDRLTQVFQVFDLPFLFPDIAAVEAFQHGPTGQEMLAALEDRGFLGLAYWHNGMKQFGAPRPMLQPDDAAGLNFRIQESDVLQAQMQAIGGIPQKMALAEVYQALQTGAIDAQENTWSNMYSQKFYEVQAAITETNHGYLGYLLAVNPTFWNGLPGEIRDELELILQQVTQEVNAESELINQRARGLVEASGRSQIITPDEQDLHAWRTAMQPVWAQFEPGIGPHIVQAARQAAASQTQYP